MTAAELRQQAVVNRHYAQRCLETFEKTGRESALRQAELHEACAARKEDLAAQVERV